jgi:D-alanyl-D-alanine dipeptidase
MKVLFIIFFAAMLICENVVYALPPNFVYLKDVDPTIIQEMKYYSSDNFVGRRIEGYTAPVCILTDKTAQALAKVQSALRKQGLGIKVYDCYRPTLAVQDFINWSHVVHDQQQKMAFYPLVNKADFFKLGYVAEKSGHSRGSTVDLTLVRFNKNAIPMEIKMGTHFDFMDERSHTLSLKISNQSKHNRLYLQKQMIDAGFKPIETEWWHFTLENEPFPRTYFNFIVS